MPACVEATSRLHLFGNHLKMILDMQFGHKAMSLLNLVPKPMNPSHFTPLAPNQPLVNDHPEKKGKSLTWEGLTTL